MKLTSEATSFADKSHSTTYPCLKISNVTGRIVLFTDRGEGTQMNEIPPNKNYEEHHIGYAASIWCEAIYKPYYGTITITQTQED